MEKLEGNNKTKEIIREYKDDLPSPGNAFAECLRWERQWISVPKENQPGFMGQKH